jgi:hypothetical protein
MRVNSSDPQDRIGGAPKLIGEIFPTVAREQQSIGRIMVKYYHNFKPFRVFLTNIEYYTL